MLQNVKKHLGNIMAQNIWQEAWVFVARQALYSLCFLTLIECKATYLSKPISSPVLHAENIKPKRRFLKKELHVSKWRHFLDVRC